MSQQEPNNNEITEKKVKKRLGLKIFLALFFLIIVVGVSVGFLNDKNNQQKMMSEVETPLIYQNIFIGDIDVGGLSPEEAKEKVFNEVQKVSDNKKVMLVDGDKNFEFHLSDFALEYDIDSAVETASSYAREGTLKERYQIIMDLKETPYKIELNSKYKEDSIKTVAETVAKDVFIAPVNATMKKENGAFVVQEGVNGTEMDIDKTVEELKKIVDAKTEGNVQIPMKSVEPAYKAESFSNAQTLIGKATTNYSGRGTGRVTNMDVAASKINGCVVYPGEIFSTNKEFGPTTYENGYRNAPVIEQGELVEGLGGGVCQISTTLYNALLESELEIVERRNHSLKVGYSNWGFDATLAGDYIDLKFKNNTDLPVYVESYLTSNQVVANIYGKEIHSPNRTLVFKNALISSTPPPAEKITYDASQPKSYRSVKVSALTGYKYEVYKFVYENGELIEKVLVNTSTYKPRRAEVIVGTGGGSKPVAEAPNEESTQSQGAEPEIPKPPVQEVTSPSPSPQPKPVEEAPPVVEVPAPVEEVPPPVVEPEPVPEPVIEQEPVYEPIEQVTIEQAEPVIEE